MKIKILAEGGNLVPGPGLSQKLGPAGLNINQVIQDINKATLEFKGLKVPVELDVDTSKRTFIVKVFSPPTSELLKREIKIEKGSGSQKKIRVANLSIEQVILIAKAKFPNMLSKNLKSAVRSVVGTCGSLGVLIENKNPDEVQEEISGGRYDKEILAGKTEMSEEKKKSLDEFYAEVKKKQDLILKQEQAAKESAEAEKKEAAPAAAPVAKEEKEAKK